MLSGACLKNRVEQFKINETIDTVFARKAGNKFRFVFRYPSNQIVCDADV